jgi:type II secretory pathway pseudopilin PulG
MEGARSSVRASGNGGFTIIEAAMVTVIIGVAFTAVMGLFYACTTQNRVANHTTVAAMLASNVQEAMAALPYSDPNPLVATFGPEPGETLETFDDIDDFHGLSINPPIDATRAPIPELSQYTQTITVTRVPANNPSGSSATETGSVRVRVVVSYQQNPQAPAEQVFSMSWLRPNH